LLASSDAAEPGATHAIRTPGEYVSLQGPKRLHLSATIEYEIVEWPDRDRGPWKVSTRKYLHHVVTDDHTEVILFHWHPDGDVKEPHIHVGSSQLGVNAVMGSNDHIPSGRVSFENVLHYLITHHGVVPHQTGWSKILADNNNRFAQWRTWH
jgi:hypothetical protein